MATTILSVIYRQKVTIDKNILLESNQYGFIIRVLIMNGRMKQIHKLKEDIDD